MDVYEELRKEKGIRSVAQDRIEHYTHYLEVLERFEEAIFYLRPQTEINMLRKKLNNARIRITPWLKKEVA